MDGDAFPDHKLSGYLLAVLSLKPPTQTLLFGTPCQIVPDGFQTQCGVALSLVDSVPEYPSNEGTDASGGEALEKSVTKCESSARKRMRRMGMVNGSMSVVRQLHALVAHNCLRIGARVVRVEFGGSNEEARVVVLVDVYLSIEVLSGWQLRRDGGVVGAVFKHMSCDWQVRRLLLNKEHPEDACSYGKSAWEISSCHVLGCKLHNDIPFPSKRRIFDLNEIFKSLPSVAKEGEPHYSRLEPADDSRRSGIWLVSDDVLVKILTELGPADLVRIAATCSHLRSLAVSIMPCMKLKLFPHQQAAIEWMLHRERNAEVLSHPFYTKFSTEDGFTYYCNTVSGEIVTGVAPAVKDFRGGLFCDEPGLGKTITALSLILKTQGTLADPPDGVQISWCTNNGNQRCGYYELDSNTRRTSDTLGKRLACQDAQSVHLSLVKAAQSYFEYASPKRVRLTIPDVENSGFNDSCCDKGMKTPTNGCFDSAASSIRSTRTVSRIKKNLQFNDTWVQCDACNKWRKLKETNLMDGSAAWFCSMNIDPLFQSCSVPEESWDNHQPITYLPGFYTKGTPGGSENNVSFFIGVLREKHTLINSTTRSALMWLAKLPQARLSEMEAVGLPGPLVDSSVAPEQGYHEIFQAFGLRKSYRRGIVRWYYPSHLVNLAFDVDALRIALREPLNSVRLYLSRATLVVVPANLVDHWKTQIKKHVRPGQLRVYVWTDKKRPAAHILAWDYDVVITTFSRLSAEWGARKRSALMQVHWLRVMLDEGHTLGSSVALTNKFQMAVSLMASNRWILTGTPTPNTPNSQLSHLQPLLKFLHEEVYGWNQKSWEDGVLRPFEREMEEGRLRLLHLLKRCMISSRKTDLQTIPPCIKKVTYLDFTEEHARSYNELVVTVRRNILMADWNDPSHVESLLNPKQWKFRSTTIKNVRLSCCVAGHIKVTDAGQDIQDTMDMLVANGCDPTSLEYASIKCNLSYGGNCLRCGYWCRLPVITPCRHLLCLDCVALSSEQCTVPGCGNHYEMQTPDSLTRPENPNPKWPVPKDLIELQPSYKQDDWDPDWQSTSSSKVSYLVDRLKELQGHNRKVGYDMDESCNANCIESTNRLPEKVIVFSQFLEHIHVIEQQLTIASINFAGMYSPMHSANKMKSLAKFHHDANCLCLLMDGSAALGLDLSFVTHLFLMEPIWDGSMEEQVISRAHRMGASRPIHVETLAMRGTIEEQMLEFLQDDDGCRRSLKAADGIPDDERPRTHKSLHDFAQNSYLSQLASVRPGSRM